MWFYFRLNKVTIADNGDGKILGLFGKDKAKVQFISLITTDSVYLPNLDDLLNETDQNKRAQLLKTAATDVASSVVFTPIDRVKDKFTIVFGDTGKVLYGSNKIPDLLNWELLCVKLNKGNRDLATELLGVLNQSDFDGFAKSFPALVGQAVSPAFTAGLVIGKFVMKAFLGHMSQQKDKQLGIIETSFIRQIDYKHGNREGVGVPDETSNLRIDYSILGSEE
jgi:hypothetical protein